MIPTLWSGRNTHLPCLLFALKVRAWAVISSGVGAIDFHVPFGVKAWLSRMWRGWFGTAGELSCKATNKWILWSVLCLFCCVASSSRLSLSVIAQTGLEITVLTQPLKCWNSRCVPSTLLLGSVIRTHSQYHFGHLSLMFMFGSTKGISSCPWAYEPYPLPKRVPVNPQLWAASPLISRLLGEQP